MKGLDGVQSKDKLKTATAKVRIGVHCTVCSAKTKVRLIKGGDSLCGAGMWLQAGCILHGRVNMKCIVQTKLIYSY